VRLHSGDDGIEAEEELEHVGAGGMSALLHVLHLLRVEEEAQILRLFRRPVRQRVRMEAFHERVRDRLAHDLMRRCVLIERKAGEEPDDGDHRLVGLRVHRNGERHNELRADGTTLASDGTALNGDGADEPAASQRDVLLVHDSQRPKRPSIARGRASFLGSARTQCHAPGTAHLLLEFSMQSTSVTLPISAPTGGFSSTR
jgi:hypothetical protein